MQLSSLSLEQFRSYQKLSLDFPRPRIELFLGPNGHGGTITGLAEHGLLAWLRETGIPAILVELSTPWYPEVERNLSALQAVLRRLAAES